MRCRQNGSHVEKAAFVKSRASFTNQFRKAIAAILPESNAVPLLVIYNF